MQNKQILPIQFNRLITVNYEGPAINRNKKIHRLTALIYMYIHTGTATR